MAQGKKGTGRGGKYQGPPCKNGHSGLRYVNGGGCVECMKITSHNMWLNDPAFRERKRIAAVKIYPTTLRNRNLLRDYGINLEQFEEMMVAQNHRCAICGVDGRRTGKKFHVDHNHDTGEVRGLLCHKCNVAIALCNDSPEQLEQAAAYLRKHGHAKLKVA